MALRSTAPETQLRRDGYVDGQESYVAAVESHWAFPALRAAIGQMQRASAAADMEAIDRAYARLKHVQTLFGFWLGRIAEA